MVDFWAYSAIFKGKMGVLSFFTDSADHELLYRGHQRMQEPGIKN